MALTTAPLRSFLQYRSDKRRLLAVASAAARRAIETGNDRQLVTALAILQLYAARRAIQAVEEQLAEQGIEAPPVATPIPAAFAGISSLGISLPGRIELTREAPAFTDPDIVRVVITEVSDASRQATGVSITTRPTVQGYVRYLNPPSCARCAILAGRVYRWSDGFQRHPNCDCDMVPVEDISEVPDWAIFDPMEAFERGLVTGLSASDEQAIRDGASMSQVVNVRRKAAGLTDTTSQRVLERTDVWTDKFGETFIHNRRLTPEGIYQIASDREEALRLLLLSGYIR